MPLFSMSYHLYNEAFVVKSFKSTVKYMKRTRVDKRVFWPQYFSKIEYVCLIGLRLT